MHKKNTPEVNSSRIPVFEVLSSVQKSVVLAEMGGDGWDAQCVAACCPGHRGGNYSGLVQKVRHYL